MQRRDLKPVSIYLADPQRQEAQQRADAKGLALATLLRLILSGHEPPLST